MLEYFTPEDNEYDDNEYHKQVRAQSQEPVNTADDKEFTLEEIRNAVDSLDNKQAPGEDGTTGEIYKLTFDTFSKFITAMYNQCLRSGIFPKRWKRSKLILVTKTRKRKW
jgi:hypothetical protein